MTFDFSSIVSQATSKRIMRSERKLAGASDLQRSDAVSTSCRGGQEGARAGRILQARGNWGAMDTTSLRPDRTPRLASTSNAQLRRETQEDHLT